MSANFPFSSGVQVSQSNGRNEKGFALTKEDCCMLEGITFKHSMDGFVKGHRGGGVCVCLCGFRVPYAGRIVVDLWLCYQSSFWLETCSFLKYKTGFTFLYLKIRS